MNLELRKELYKEHIEPQIKSIREKESEQRKQDQLKHDAESKSLFIIYRDSSTNVAWSQNISPLDILRHIKGITDSKKAAEGYIAEHNDTGLSMLEVPFLIK